MQREFPVGTIQAWSGAIVDIPSTWRLCDGTHGTPDLRDKFVVGAGTTYNPNDNNPATTHNHTGTGLNLQHAILPGAAIAAGANIKNITNTAVATITTLNANANMHYYSEAFIMYAGVPL